MRIVSLGLVAALSLMATGTLAKTPPQHWVTTWASAQMIPGNDSPLPIEPGGDGTLRQIVRVAEGGTSFRIRMSNSQSTVPLHLKDIHVALATAVDSPATVAGSDRTVTFNGATDVVIPPWSDFISDPIDLTAADNSDIAISLYFPEAPKMLTGHPGSRTTSYLVSGDHTADATLSDAKTFNHWFNISAIDVAAKPGTAGIIAFGDSITDGYGITPNSNTRYTDDLNVRLHSLPRALAHAHRPVLNLGIGGNRLLLDGLGPNALARFDRDVLSLSGARYVLVLEGINDLGVLTRDATVPPEDHAAMVRQIEQAYVQMIDRAHSHDLLIYGATIMPFGGNDYYHPEAVTEADRQAVNLWIRTSGRFDGVIDFDMALRDPQQPDRLNPVYDSGDHLHPSPAGYKAMAEAVDLKLFK